MTSTLIERLDRAGCRILFFLFVASIILPFVTDWRPAGLQGASAAEYRLYRWKEAQP